jgi:hypothetical protein
MFVTLNLTNGKRLTFAMSSRVAVRDKGPKCDVYVDGQPFEVVQTHDEVVSALKVGLVQMAEGLVEMLRARVGGLVAVVDGGEDSFVVAAGPADDPEPPPAPPAAPPKRNRNRKTEN